MSLASQIALGFAAVATAINGKGPKYITVNAQTGTTYTLVLTDVSKAIECNNAAAVTVTVPPNSSVAFPIGTIIEVLQVGAGKVTVAAGAGVTINAAGAVLGARAQWSAMSIRKRATDSWILVGDTA